MSARSAHTARRRSACGLLTVGTLVGAACANNPSSEETVATPSPTAPATAPAATVATTATTSSTTTSSTTTSSTTTTSTAVTTSTTAPEPPTGLAWRTTDIVDTNRPTREVVGFDGEVKLAAQPTRTLPTVLVYEGVDGGGEDAAAADVDPKPLIVWVNGIGGFAAAGDPLLLALVDAGYVVAAPNGPELSAPIGSASGLAETPGDVSAVIDALLDDTDGVADDLAAQVDPERIGVAGHSIGASGALGAAFHDCCRDERIDAAVAFGRNPAFDFDGGEFRFDGGPLLLIHGDADDIAPLTPNQQTVESATGPVHLLTLEGGDHFEPIYGDDQSAMAVDARAVVVEFLDVHVTGSKTPEQLDVMASSLTTGTWSSAPS